MSQALTAVAPFPATQSSRSAIRIEAELSRLMGDHECALLLFIRCLLGDTDLARDCVQDTFLRAYESLCRGRQINKSWLWTVARNRAMDEFRHRRRLWPESDDLTAVPFDTASETSIIVQQVMARLPRQYREVLYLFVVAGFQTEEIALLLGISGPAVRQRLYRAREAFRRVYGKEEGYDT
jgi:RNA polymerase sigma-70 factor, ECF subfamily